jgi:hypothetical protein
MSPLFMRGWWIVDHAVTLMESTIAEVTQQQTTAAIKNNTDFERSRCREQWMVECQVSLEVIFLGVRE